MEGIKTPIVRQEYCVMQYGCKNCIITCPERAIKTIHLHRRGNKKVASIEPELCEGCGLCYQVCPTVAIEDVNAVDYRTKALETAGKGRVIIFACEHTPSPQSSPHWGEEAKGFPSPLWEEGWGAGQSSLIKVPDISIVSWRDIFKVMAIGSPVVMVGCRDCRYTAHFRQLAEVFRDSCYEGAFRFYIPPPQSSPQPGEEVKGFPSPLWGEGQNLSRTYFGGEGGLDKDILEEIITSYKGRIPFPGTAWVDIGERCSLCQGCANVCPTGALHVQKTDRRLSLMYDHSLCKGCPVCEKVCPERCITIDRRVRLDRLFSVEKRCEKGILFCRGCNRPLTTDAVFEKVKGILTSHGQPTDHLEYCPDCKARGVRLETEGSQLLVPADSKQERGLQQAAAVRS